jgi:hypothetical protein
MYSAAEDHVVPEAYVHRTMVTICPAIRSCSRPRLYCPQVPAILADAPMGAPSAAHRRRRPSSPLPGADEHRRPGDCLARRSWLPAERLHDVGRRSLALRRRPRLDLRHVPQLDQVAPSRHRSDAPAGRSGRSSRPRRAPLCLADTLCPRSCCTRSGRRSQTQTPASSLGAAIRCDR